jgi:2-aminoadipate transaminase
MTNWTLAARAHKMNPSVIREILKVTEKPGIISFAGGLPSPKTFPVDAMLEATQRVLTQDGRSALQYAASEGYGPLRDWVAHDLKKQGMDVHADQVLITTGSQQGLDLVAKILIDAGSRILVETPTYLGALQAFTPMEPDVVSVDSDDSGVLADDLRAKAGQGAARARFIYLLPNFQNPTGRTMTEARRAAVAAAALATGVPVIEDNPYGDLWFDTAPPPSLSSRNPEGSVYLGSFSKILAPGLRLGYLVAPPALYPKLLQAKQAADLHTPSFNQRLVAEVLKDGFIERHVPTIRALYKQQCEAMLAALDREMAGLDFQFNRPAGGMFLWARLPEGVDAVGLLPKAVDRGVAFVPGAAFYADHGDPRTLRLSFVTASVDQINTGLPRWRRRSVNTGPERPNHAAPVGPDQFHQRAQGAVDAAGAGRALRTHRRRAGLRPQPHAGLPGEKPERAGATAGGRRLHPLGIQCHRPLPLRKARSGHALP